MKSLRVILILALLIVNLNVHAQEDKLISLIETAWNYNDSGDYQKSVEVWDSFLKEVRRIEGEDCEHFFMGMIYKADALIKLEKYQDAEKVLLAAKVPSAGVDIRLTLTSLKSLGECAFKQDKRMEAYHMYKDAYDFLLANKEYYTEYNAINNHWCWSDELCSIGLQLARLYRQNGEFGNAESTIYDTFGNLREDNSLCFEFNGEGLYLPCFDELVKVYNDILCLTVSSDDFETSLAVYDIALSVCTNHPSLIANLKEETLTSLFTHLIKEDKGKGVLYVDTYINHQHQCIEYWYNEGFFESVKQCQISKQFEYLKFARLCKDLAIYDLAEDYYKKAKVFLENNNLRRTEEYLNILDQISYVLEDIHKSSSSL